MKTAIVGIHPKTKRAEIVATDTPENRAECEREKLIVVPTTMEKARQVWGEVIDDMDSLLVPNAELKRGSTTPTKASDA